MYWRIKIVCCILNFWFNVHLDCARTSPNMQHTLKRKPTLWLEMYKVNTTQMSNNYIYLVIQLFYWVRIMSSDITKDVIKMVPDASLLSAQHIRTGLASLSSQTSFKMDRVYHMKWAIESDNISLDNLFRNRP